MTADIQPMTVVLAREPAFQLGGLLVRPSTREVICPDGREVLEPRVMQVLVVLARRPGEVVSRDDLTAHCWGGRVVGEDAINRVIGRIRRLSERDASRHFALETVRKVGYRLLPAEEAAVAPPSPAQAQPAQVVPSSTEAPTLTTTPAMPSLNMLPPILALPRRRAWRMTAILTIAAVVLLLSATALASWQAMIGPDTIATSPQGGFVPVHTIAPAPKEDRLLLKGISGRATTQPEPWNALIEASLSGLAVAPSTLAGSLPSRTRQATRDLGLEGDDAGV